MTADDDTPAGRVHTRREALARLGAAALAALPFVDARGAVCVATPAQTEGPFYLDTRLERSDLRTDPAGGAAPRAGLPLALEGTFSPKRIVIIEFPSLAAAKAWHASPEYAPLLALRQRASKGDVFAVEGV